MDATEDQKQAAAQAAAELVEAGMRVGLGTGTTVAHFLPALARRGLDVVCVATSSATEEQVFAQLGLAYVPPLLREDRGEIALAQQGSVPALVQVEDIKGDLHSHTNNSDGRNTIEEMAAGAIARGYQYLNITDHSKSQGIITGIDAAAYPEQVARVRAAAKEIEAKGVGRVEAFAARSLASAAWRPRDPTAATPRSPLPWGPCWWRRWRHSSCSTAAP